MSTAEEYIAYIRDQNPGWAKAGKIQLPPEKLFAALGAAFRAGYVSGIEKDRPTSSDIPDFLKSFFTKPRR